MEELEKVKLSYASGELDSLRQQLESFIISNKDRILQFKRQEERNWKCSLDLATALKLFILHVRSIDTQSEMSDQIKAINKEMGSEFRGETAGNSCCINWIQRYAPVWRGFRVLAIIYVFDQHKEQLLSYFNEL
jgi:hypothetical protein